MSRVHALPAPRKLPAVRMVLAQLLGWSAALHALLATFFILREDWGSWVSIAWLTPGARIFSPEYALFLLTSAVFFLGGVLTFSRPGVGLYCTGLGFGLSLACIFMLAPEEATSEELLGLFAFLILPGWWFASGGIHVPVAHEP